MQCTFVGHLVRGCAECSKQQSMYCNTVQFKMRCNVDPCRIVQLIERKECRLRQIRHAGLCTLHTAHCTLHTAHCTLHTALCSRTVLCELCYVSARCINSSACEMQLCCPGGGYGVVHTAVHCSALVQPNPPDHWAGKTKFGQTKCCTKI
jgi:hypothetical protein